MFAHHIKSVDHTAVCGRAEGATVTARNSGIHDAVLELERWLASDDCWNLLH